jgi:ketosteroid isomerase-like protein
MVPQGLTAFLRDDTQAAQASVRPDVVLVRTPPLPDPQTYRGTEGVLQMWADWTAEFADFDMTVGEFLETRDNVIVEVYQRETGSGGGGEVEGRFWFVYTFAEGEVVRTDVFGCLEQALEAANADP